MPFVLHSEFWILKFILHTIDIMNKRDLMDTDIENTTGPTEDSMETEDSVRYFKLPSSYKQRKGKNVKFTITVLNTITQKLS